jgi:hypothetical protein
MLRDVQKKKKSPINSRQRIKMEKMSASELNVKEEAAHRLTGSGRERGWLL